jgi:hypothetical protein
LCLGVLVVSYLKKLSPPRHEGEQREAETGTLLKFVILNEKFVVKTCCFPRGGRVQEAQRAARRGHLKRALIEPEHFSQSAHAPASGGGRVGSGRARKRQRTPE